MSCGIAGEGGEGIEAAKFKQPLEVLSRYVFVTPERHRNLGELSTGPGQPGRIWQRR